MQVKLTQSYVQGLKADGRKHWIRDALDNKLLLYLGKNGAKTWYVDYFREDGKRACHKIGPAPDIITVAVARDKAREFLARVTLGESPDTAKPKPALTLRELFEDHYLPWVTEHRRGGAETAAMIRNAFGDFMGEKITALSALRVDQWRTRYRAAQSTKAATMNRYVTTLKAMFNWGVKHKLIPENPLAGIETLREEDSERKIRYLSPDERERLLRALSERGRPDYLKPMIIVALNTGIRRGSLFALKWADVDFERRVLTVRAEAEKSGKENHLPMNDAVFQALREWRAGHEGPGLVFASKTGEALDNCRNSFKSLLKDAGIENFRWHDMRHDFASQLVMRGVDLNTVRELMGHADLKMTLRYAHLAPYVKRAAVDLL